MRWLLLALVVAGCEEAEPCARGELDPELDQHCSCQGEEYDPDVYQSGYIEQPADSVACAYTGLPGGDGGGCPDYDLSLSVCFCTANDIDCETPTGKRYDSGDFVELGITPP